MKEKILSVKQKLDDCISQLSETRFDIDRIVDGKIVEHGGSTETFETFWTNGLIKPV